MGHKIAITTSSFAKMDESPLEYLKKHNIEYVLNPFGRMVKEEELLSLLEGCQGVIAGTEKYTKSLLNQLPDLKIISRVGVGTDSIDVEELHRLGKKLNITPGGPTKAVSELVIGLMLNLLRNISIQNTDLHQGVWSKLMGRLLSGKTVGIIGFGRIGQEVGRLASVLGCSILYYDIQDISVKGYVAQQSSLEEVLKASDIISLHLNYHADNHHILGKKELALMKSEGLLVNVSRGGLIDEEALYDVLKSKHIRGAALDVFEKEPYQGNLKDLENVILTPHIGAYAEECRIQMEMDAVHNLVDFFNKV